MSIYRNDDLFLLAEELRKGNEKAFRKFFDLFRNDIFAYAKCLLKSNEAAEEVVQDVFLKVWVNRESINPKLSIKSYIFTIAKNAAFDSLSKAAKDDNLLESLFYLAKMSISPIEDFLDEQHYQDIKTEAINSLPPRRKQIFELSRNRGMSYQEISSELGISTQTVKNQMHLALGSITVFLKRHGEITFLFLLPLI